MGYALASLLCAALVGQTKEAEVRELQASAAELQKAVQSNPSDAEAHARLGMVYRRLGRLAEATEYLERSTRLEPNPRVKVLLAFNYMDAGRHGEAIPLLAPSWETEPKPSVRAAVGQRLLECYLATGEQEQALAVAQKLRQLAPDDPDVLYLAAKVYMSLWSGAFQRMMGKDPNSLPVRLILAEGLEAQERFAEAANEYREILKTSPQRAGIHYRLARMILRSDLSADADQKALAELRRELEINPAHAGALTEIGEIHLKRSQLEGASRAFSQAVSLQPGDAAARVGLARVLIAERQWSKALEHLEAAAKATPAEEAVFYNLMLAYRGLGRSADAKRALDAFQRLQQENQRRRSSAMKALPPP
jgi:tetratricopeptide (TPR) repeat protein